MNKFVSNFFININIYLSYNQHLATNIGCCIIILSILFLLKEGDNELVV